MADRKKGVDPAVTAERLSMLAGLIDAPTLGASGSKKPPTPPPQPVHPFPGPLHSRRGSRAEEDTNKIASDGDHRHAAVATLSALSVGIPYGRILLGLCACLLLCLMATTQTLAYKSNSLPTP